MKALKEFRVFWLDFPSLRVLPEPSSGDLEHLEVFHLWGVRIWVRPGKSPDLGCIRVQELFYCSGLRSLPDSFGRPGAFPVLKELLMTICKAIETFPELQPGAMPQIMVLDFHDCDQLVDFPEGIGNLTKLRCLDFQGCINLQSLENDSVGLQNLTDLEELDVSWCNRISELPVSLAHLPKLRSIDMLECPALVPEQIENLAAEGRIELRRGL